MPIVTDRYVPGVVLYEWLSGQPFLARALFEGATILDARIDDPPEEVLTRIPRDTGWFLFHLNCTVTDNFPYDRQILCRLLEDKGIRLLNRFVTDISKRHVQDMCRQSGLNTTLTGPEGPGDELIIVKTNLNFAGKSEWGLTETERQALGVGAGSDMIWDPYHYQVIPRSKVEAGWWQDPSLVCERYISNADDRWYRAYLLKSRFVLCELVSPYQVKKVGESKLQRLWMASFGDELRVDHPLSGHVPKQLLGDLAGFARSFKLDFGTIDVVESNEAEHYIIDVNSTPAYNNPVPGLVDYLRQELLE